MASRPHRSGSLPILVPGVMAAAYRSCAPALITSIMLPTERLCPVCLCKGEPERGKEPATHMAVMLS